MSQKDKKVRLTFGVALLFGLFLLPACTTELDDKQSTQLAKEHIENNRLRAANLELKNALKANAKNAEARYLLGNLYVTLGDMPSAIKEFGKAGAAGWNEAQIQIGLMRAYIFSNQFKKVIDEIDIKDNYATSEKANLYGLKAFAAAATGDLALARDLIENGKELKADAYQVVKTDIQLNVSKAEFALAFTQLDAALQRYGDNAELLLLKAFAGLQSNNKDIAVEAFGKVLAEEPKILVTFNGRRARLGMTRIELMNKDFTRAEKMLMPLLNQDASDPEANYMGGLLAFETGQYDIAEERLLKVLKVAPEHSKTLLLFGTVNFAQEDFEQASYYMSKYIQAQPGDITARKLLGRAYMKMGQLEDAKAVLKAGLNIKQDDAELLGLIGISQLQSGNIALGISELEKAVVKAPASDALRNELAMAYIAAGDNDKAIQQLNTILDEGGRQHQSKVLLISAHLRAEQYDKAIGVALEIKNQSPDDAATQLLVGRVFVVSKDNVEARKYFNKALQIKPDYLQALMSLAELEEREGRLSETEALYKKAAKKHPKSTMPLLALARLAEAQKKMPAMVDWLEKARALNKNDIVSRKILAVHYLAEQQLKKSRLIVDEALKISQADNSLMVLQARLQMAEGRHNKAMQTLNALVARVPESNFVRAMLAETYIKLDQPSDARKQLAIVLENQPYYTPALALLASLDLQAAQYDQAQKNIDKILQVQPDSSMAHELAGDVQLVKKVFSEATKFYQKAWQKKRTATLAIKLSQASSRVGDFEAATKPLHSWLDENPNDAFVLQLLGTAYLNMENNKKASTMFEKALKLQPENIIALNNLAWLYSMAGNNKALPLAEKAYRINSEDGGIQDTYGWILLQQGHYEKGLRVLEQAIRQLPDVPEVQYHYAVALMKTGDKAKAQQLLQKLLDSGAAFEGQDDARRLLK